MDTAWPLPCSSAASTMLGHSCLRTWLSDTVGLRRDRPVERRDWGFDRSGPCRSGHLDHRLPRLHVYTLGPAAARFAAPFIDGVGSSRRSPRTLPSCPMAWEPTGRPLT